MHVYSNIVGPYVTAPRAENTDVQLLRSLFDLMPQLGWTADPDGYIDFYNKRWYEYTGTTYEEQQGFGWESCHDPAILPSVRQWYDNAILSKETTTMQFPLRRRDGVYRWFLTTMSPIFDAGGTLVRWVGINTDIQEQRDLTETLERQVAERTCELQDALNVALEANIIKTQFVSTISHEVRTPMSGVIGLAEVLTMRDLDPESQMIANAIFDSAKRLLRFLTTFWIFQSLNPG